nr:MULTISPECIES: methylthioribose kinase [unclassified Mesobacillus]
MIETARANRHRLMHLMAIHTKVNEKEVSSLLVVLKPTNPGNFQALYICREGISNPHILKNKRFDMFKELADELDKTIIEFDAKPSTMFAEKELYFQYLIGILRLNHYIPPLQ